MLRNGLNAIAFMIITLAAQAQAQGGSADGSVQAEVSIPDTVKMAFISGLSLPVTLKNVDNKQEDNQAIVLGDVTVTLINDLFVISDVNIEGSQVPYKLCLSQEAMDALQSIKGKSLTKNGQLQVSPDIQLYMNTLTMNLELLVDEKFFGVEKISRDIILPEPTVHNFSSLFQYDLNAYQTHVDGVDSNSAYLNFQSQSAIGANHLALEGTISSGDGNEQTVALNKAMYELDANGKRVAAGMLDSWSMQELGSISTLNSSRIYGVSYGNTSQTIKVNSSQAINPIVAYFPSAGEARIFRENQLLSIQRVSMGTHELDTSGLPSGMYDVRVDVVVGGRVVSSRVQHINKISESQQYPDGLVWQLWGGRTENSSYYSSIDSQENSGLGSIFGVSLASNWLDVNWKLSLYKNNQTTVEEGQANWQLSNGLRFDLQNLSSSDASKQWMTRVSYDLPDSIGSVWASRQRGTDGNKLPFYSQSYDSAGVSLNLGSWVNNAGSLNISVEDDEKLNSQYVRTDYDQMIYSGHYGSAQLQVGMVGSDFYSGEKQYYATLNFSLPLSTDFQLGLSQQGNQRELDLQVGKSFEDSLVNYAAASVSTTMVDGQQSSRLGAYLDYAGRYGQGAISIDGSNGSTSVSLANHGVFSLTGNGVAAGSGAGDAALVIDVPDIKTGDLEAILDDQVYPLSSGRNLVSVPSYNTYKVSVRNNRDSDNSYEITQGVENYTLYPGNVGEINPSVKQMITVFGHLVDDSGQPLANAKINNHIGITTSDDNGDFAVDVEKLHPVIEVKTKTKKFNVSMNFDGAGSTMWLGDVSRKNDLSTKKYKIDTFNG